MANPQIKAHPAKGKQNTTSLPRIDTSYSPKQFLTSSISGSTAVTSSSRSWTAQSRLESASTQPAYPSSAYLNSALAHSSRKRYHDVIDTTILFSPRLHTPTSSSPGQPLPPLSARSASFVLAMQQCSKLFSSVLESYLHQPSRPASTSPPCQKMVFGSDTCYPTQVPSRAPLSPVRRMIVLVCSVMLVLSVLVPVLLVSRHDLLKSTTGQHLVMGGTGSVIFTSGMIMFAARRSIKEILAMAAVGVTVCQCIMSDINAAVSG
jgi:hypothetical protein